jgi:penicillin-binding protein 1A
MNDTASATGDSFRYRLTRGAGGWWAWFKDNWRQSRLFNWVAILFGGLLFAYFLVWLFLARGLPDATMLLEYEPPLPTMVRGIDGEIVDSYARERRVQLQFRDFPEKVIDAYLAAEDKTFWTHGGIDIGGFVGAVIDYTSKLGSGERAVGGSTITQQVAKNIMVGDEYSVTRKLKEMILARRIEGVLTKEQILELYLNEIPLGRRGVPRDPAQGARALWPPGKPRGRDCASQLGARRDGR